MEYIAYEFPELDEVQKFNPSQQNTLIHELNALNDYKQQVVEILLEQKIMHALERHSPHIQSVIVHPTCVREENGYQFQNAMVWVNDWVDPSGQNNAQSRFQESLDKSLADLAPLMRNVIEFNIPQLQAKYQVEKTTEPLVKAPIDEKTDFSESKVKPKYKF